MALAERIELAVAPVREAYEGLTDREKRMVTMLGSVVVLIAVVLPMYFGLDAIAEMETENRAIVSALHELDSQGENLRQRAAEHEAAQRRYETQAPPLGGFLEQQATRQGLTLREVTDEPNQVIGNFTRRRVRAQIPGVQLQAMMRMLEAIENSNFPVSIERIEVEKLRDGEAYNFRIGVSAYDRGAGGAAAERTAGAR